MSLRAFGEAAGFLEVNRENVQDILRENVAGSRCRDSRSSRLIDLERNTNLALDEQADELVVDSATQAATVTECRLKGRRDVEDPETRRWYSRE